MYLFNKFNIKIKTQAQNIRAMGQGPVISPPFSLQNHCYISSVIAIMIYINCISDINKPFTFLIYLNIGLDEMCLEKKA